ncbi:MAG TPA: TadE/TadG family type IV pilus assembly protein [Candidatus Limnocylindrales bacterium]|jgi:Flp pilus assembly protein TadG
MRSDGAPFERARSNGRPRTREGGQSLVEFALVIPLFLVVFVGLIEFALVLNAVMSINYASREASLIGAEAGNNANADCMILEAVDTAVGAPASRTEITRVRIYQANRVGTPIAGRVNTYNRGGETSCDLPDGTVVRVPYTRVGVAGYPATSRCNVLAGCGTTTTVDQIGVEVTYVYEWRTPLHTLLNLSGTGYILTKSNAMRMEPVL